MSYELLVQMANSPLDIACATGDSFSLRHPKLIKRALAKNENIR